MSYHSQENSAITDQNATRFDTGQRPRRVNVVASTDSQAQLVADQLGLGPQGWRRVHTARDLRGLEPDDIVVALPMLGHDVAQYELLEEVRQLEYRFGWRVKEVST